MAIRYTSIKVILDKILRDPLFTGLSNRLLYRLYWNSWSS